MDGLQAVVAFAFAAIPGVVVVEMLEFGQPRLRERYGARSFAVYLIVSAAVWATAAAFLDIDGRLAIVIDSAQLDGRTTVAAYMALAWRLAVTAFGLGSLLRAARWLLERLGDVDLRSPFAWDALLFRVGRGSRAQVVHVRLRDGAEVYGVLASKSHADFQAEGRGLLLDVELVAADGTLTKVPGSNGIFIAPDVVATVALLEHETFGLRGKVKK